jgi:hypothetical protein
MNTEFDKDVKYDPKPQPDSFKKPRTIPSNWDVSAFSTQIPETQKNGIEQQSDGQQVDEPEEGQQSSEEWNPEPFPEPRTIPGKWDTSNLE